MNYVIIGNSAAAVGAAEGIRQLDPEGPVTLISREPYATYSRPLIAYWLKGKTDDAHMGYRDADFYRRNKLTLRFSSTAVRIDVAGRKVVLEDGEQVAYDKLLLATGSKPNLPDTPGLDKVQSIFRFLAFDDAKQVAAAISPASRVLIWGGGLIGLKCAEALQGQVAEVTVINRSAHMLRSIFDEDEDASALLEQHFIRQGVRLLLGRGVDRFDPKTAYLSGGEQVDFDVLILSIGVQPNSALLTAAGGQVNRDSGIVVDDFMATTLPDVYAAGDCVEIYDLSSRTRRVMATLPNAYVGGECAGINMAGGKKTFPGTLPVNSVNFFGLQLATAGTRRGDTYTEKPAGGLKKLFFADDRLQGFIMIGNIARAGIYTDLIRAGTPLSQVDFPALCKSPGLIAFTQPQRRKILGGALPV
jgi:NAD(P)H-nitrite reductase large subunit